MRVTPEEILIIARLVKDLCGVILDSTKGYLVETRLSEVAEKHQCKTFSELYYKARYANERTLQNDIIDAITTQETLFFRDTSPFEALQHRILPDLIDQKIKTSHPKKIRIWCAACSTGQEPYSIAMTLFDLLPSIHQWDINILATDIADVAIKQASRGIYANHEIQRGMKSPLLAKYFTQQGNNWCVKDALRSLIAFRKLNILEPFSSLGPFDIVFCRNVAIYFNIQDRRSLFQRIKQVMTPTGYLFVGSSESLTDLSGEFSVEQHCRAHYYRPRRFTSAPVPV